MSSPFIFFFFFNHQNPFLLSIYLFFLFLCRKGNGHDLPTIPIILCNSSDGSTVVTTVHLPVWITLCFRIPDRVEISGKSNRLCSPQSEYWYGICRLRDHHNLGYRIKKLYLLRRTDTKSDPMSWFNVVKMLLFNHPLSSASM